MSSAIVSPKVGASLGYRKPTTSGTFQAISLTGTKGSGIIGGLDKIYLTYTQHFTAFLVVALLTAFASPAIISGVGVSQANVLYFNAFLAGTYSIFSNLIIQTFKL